AQEQQILSEWGSVLPNPAFDYAYSWGVQDGDTALSGDSALQQVFAAHNSAAPVAGSYAAPAAATQSNIALAAESLLTSDKNMGANLAITPSDGYEHMV